MNGIKGFTYKTSLLIFGTLLILTACGGSSEQPPIIEPEPTPASESSLDTTPAGFSFESSAETPINTLINSNKITVSDINTASPINISGGEYSIDGSEFSSLPSTVTNKQTVLVRLLSSKSYSTANDLTLTIGDISATFSATTHGPLTKFAHELSANLDAKYSVVTQPNQGRVIVSSDLTKLTYQPLNSFDYLSRDETAQVTVKATLIGEGAHTHELVFTITGQNSPHVCDDRTIIDITASEVNQPLTHVTDGNCVRLSASQLNGGDAWSIWTGENGAARSVLFSVLGINASDPNITFLPPAGGRYSLSWCPTSGSCLASFYFYSDTATNKKELDVKLNIHNISPEDEILLSVTENNHADTASYSYRWIIHDWTGEYHKLIDVVTTTNRLKIPAPMTHNNYEITVVVDDNIPQLEGSFTSTANDLYGQIKINANTLGNYKKLSDSVITRDEYSNKKPPILVVMIDGDPTRYKGDKDVVFTINTTVGSELSFDLSETFDENGDTLDFFINGALQESASKRFSFDVITDAYYNICTSDGFPWTGEENPCLLFDVLAK